MVHEEMSLTREKAYFSDSLWSLTPSHALNEQYYHKNKGANSVHGWNMKNDFTEA
jgi:hypothetical protein